MQILLSHDADAGDGDNNKREVQAQSVSQWMLLMVGSTDEKEMKERSSGSTLSQ